MLVHLFLKSEQMKTNVQQEKTKRPKNLFGIEHTARLAAICNCSPRMVRYALAGERGKHSILATKIKVANLLLKQRDAITAFEVREKILSKNA